MIAAFTAIFALAAFIASFNIPTSDGATSAAQVPAGDQVFIGEEQSGAIVPDTIHAADAAPPIGSKAIVPFTAGAEVTASIARIAGETTANAVSYLGAIEMGAEGISDNSASAEVTASHLNGLGIGTALSASISQAEFGSGAISTMAVIPDYSRLGNLDVADLATTAAMTTDASSYSSMSSSLSLEVMARAHLVGAVNFSQGVEDTLATSVSTASRFAMDSNTHMSAFSSAQSQVLLGLATLALVMFAVRTAGLIGMKPRNPHILRNGFPMLGAPAG